MTTFRLWSHVHADGQPTRPLALVILGAVWGVIA